MKSFLKIGLLFALIITGRYMQSVGPTATSMQRKPPIVLFAPDSMTLTTYTTYPEAAPVTIIPASQHKGPAVRWY